MLFPPDRPFPVTAPRVVVTGAGIVTALGIGWRANAEGFRAGRTAFRPVTLFDVSRHRVKVAAEVDLPDTMPATRLTRKMIQRLDRATLMLLLATHEAWVQAAWEPSEDLPMVLGTTSGGMSLGEEYYRRAVAAPAGQHRQPTRVRQYLSHVQTRAVAEAFGFQGPVTRIANACASGANALGHAWEMLRRGCAERVLAGGYDALSLLVFSGFDSLQALSRTRCRPFAAQRDGLALGEGAAVLTLETLDLAQRRGAKILGEVIGYAAALDVHHLTQPHPHGDAAWQTMTQACQAAGITAAEVDYVNAHGTGTSLNDSSEALAINRWAGERAPTLPVSSTKTSIGHLLGAAGAVEAVVCLMALREQWLPPEVGIGSVDPVCRFPVICEPASAQINVALSNSFGFGGANATLVFRRWTPSGSI